MGGRGGSDGGGAIGGAQASGLCGAVRSLRSSRWRCVNVPSWRCRGRLLTKGRRASRHGGVATSRSRDSAPTPRECETVTATSARVTNVRLSLDHFRQWYLFIVEYNINMERFEVLQATFLQLIDLVHQPTTPQLA